MKTLKTIQILSKIGKILSKILFVFCIVGFCFCLVGVVSVAAGLPALKIGDVTLEGLIRNEAGLSKGDLLVALSVGMAICLGEGVTARFASLYFDRELKDGTPFTLGGSKELLRLGILAIGVPLVTQCVAGIVYAILSRVTDVTGRIEHPTVSGAVAVGIVTIITAFRVARKTKKQQRQQNNGPEIP